jgi:cysteine synthase
VKVSEGEAVRRTLQLRDQGIFCGLQTGGVMHSAVVAAQRYGIEGKVVIISGDTGWKNMDKLLQVRA